MSKLIFNAADVRRVVDHTLKAQKQRQYADWSTANLKNDWTPVMRTPSRPMVILVHDQGVYLMSNGDPRDMVDPKRNDEIGVKSFAAYADGCDPGNGSDDWYDNARALVGGDDFAEYLEWADAIKQMLDKGATHIIVNFSEKRLSLSARYPKRRAA